MNNNSSILLIGFLIALLLFHVGFVSQSYATPQHGGGDMGGGDMEDSGSGGDSEVGEGDMEDSGSGGDSEVGEGDMEDSGSGGDGGDSDDDNDNGGGGDNADGGANNPPTPTNIQPSDNIASLFAGNQPGPTSDTQQQQPRVCPTASSSSFVDSGRIIFVADPFMTALDPCPLPVPPNPFDPAQSQEKDLLKSFSPPQSSSPTSPAQSQPQPTTPTPSSSSSDGTAPANKDTTPPKELRIPPESRPIEVWKSTTQSDKKITFKDTDNLNTVTIDPRGQAVFKDSHGVAFANVKPDGSVAFKSPGGNVYVVSHGGDKIDNNGQGILDGEEVEGPSLGYRDLKDSNGKTFGSVLAGYGSLPTTVKFLDPAGQNQYIVDTPDPLKKISTKSKIFVDKPFITDKPFTSYDRIELGPDGSTNPVPPY